MNYMPIKGSLLPSNKFFKIMRTIDMKQSSKLISVVLKPFRMMLWREVFKNLFSILFILSQKRDGRPERLLDISLHYYKLRSLKPIWQKNKINQNSVVNDYRYHYDLPDGNEKILKKYWSEVLFLSLLALLSSKI